MHGIFGIAAFWMFFDVNATKEFMVDKTNGTMYSTHVHKFIYSCKNLNCFYVSIEKFPNALSCIDSDSRKFRGWLRENFTLCDGIEELISSFIIKNSIVFLLTKQLFFDIFHVHRLVFFFDWIPVSLNTALHKLYILYVLPCTRPNKRGGSVVK